jgi:hypothetical protein
VCLHRDFACLCDCVRIYSLDLNYLLFRLHQLHSEPRKTTKTSQVIRGTCRQICTSLLVQRQRSHNTPRVIIPRFQFDRAVEPSTGHFNCSSSYARSIVQSRHCPVRWGRWKAAKNSSEVWFHPLRAGNGQAPVSHDLINRPRPLQLHTAVYIYVEPPRLLTSYLLCTIAFNHHFLVCRCLQLAHHVDSERRESQR